jgi:hypothetical protein
MSSYDKIADIMMNTPSDQVTLKFDDVQGLLREFRERQFALEATLLFHSGGLWDKEKSSKWFQITKAYDATTKVLCDHVRQVLRRADEPDVSESPSANANLIAAAPDMLAALEATIRDDDDPDGRLSGNTVATIRAAIKKARGDE